jgi:hypothetical protein
MRTLRLTLVALSIGVTACASVPMRDSLASGSFEAALAELEQTPEAEQEELVRAIARSRLSLGARDSDPRRRAAAFARIASGGTGTRALLGALERSSDADVETRALLALTLLGDGGATSRLARFADDEDEVLRERGRIAETIGLSRRAALERLSSTSADERRAALRALDGNDDVGVIEAMIAVARRDPDEGVRAAACRAMPPLTGTQRDVVKMIADEARSTGVVTACTKRLLATATEDEALAFVVALTDPADDLAIARAQGALAALDDGAAATALIEYLLRALAAPRPSIRAAAANLLAVQRNNPVVRNALVRMLEDEVEPDTKLAVAAALRADTATRARVLAMLHTLAALEAYAGLEAAALAVTLEGFTPETQAKIERASHSAVAAERALAYRVFVQVLDVRRVLEGLFDADEEVRFGTAARLLDR